MLELDLEEDFEPTLDFELVLELDFEFLDEFKPLEVPPIPPAFAEVPLLVMEPVEEVDVLGFTTDPATFLFWNLSLL